MQFSRIQKCLAILSSQPELAARFASDPAASSEIFGFAISDAEKSYLIEFNQKQLRLFAGSLAAKRINELQGIFPRTSEILGLEFKRKYLEFLKTESGASSNKNREQTLAFAYFLSKQLAIEKKRFEADLVVFEASWHQARTSGRCFLLKALRHGAGQLIQKKRELAGPSKLKPHIYCWLRVGKAGKLHFFKLF